MYVNEIYSHSMILFYSQGFIIWNLRTPSGRPISWTYMRIIKTTFRCKTAKLITSHCDSNRGKNIDRDPNMILFMIIIIMRDVKRRKKWSGSGCSKLSGSGGWLGGFRLASCQRDCELAKPNKHIKTRIVNRSELTSDWQTSRQMNWQLYGQIVR